MKISITNFGPIENAQVEFAKLLIFTGDSNLGKSYVNYLMYYIISSTSYEHLYKYFFSSRMKSKSDYEVTIEYFQKKLDERVQDFMRDFLNAPQLTCDVHFDLQLSVPNDKYNIVYEEQDFIGGETSLLKDYFKSVTVTINGDKWTDNFPPIPDLRSFAVAIAFSKKIQRGIFGSEIDQSFILPPARGAFVGENYTMKERIASSVGMYRVFLKDYDSNTRPRKRVKKSSDVYASQIERLINGKLVTKEGNQYLQLKTGKELPLSAAASSIKELSPMLYALQANPAITQSFCIEEPEAHLHPQMQISLVDLIANCYSDGKYFQFTTHSDYVIQRVNQLIKLNHIKNNNRKEFASLCDKYKLTRKHCIDNNDVKVYYFNVDKSGKVVINNLQVDEQGIPMVSFFEVVRSLTNIEDDFNNAIDEIQRLEK